MGMESPPATAERLMTPTAVNRGGSSLYPPLVGFLLSA
jgi:hypothetical protein